MQLNWLSVVAVVAYAPSAAWASGGQGESTFMVAKIVGAKEMNTVYAKGSIPGAAWLSVYLFIFIGLNNFLGLFSYIFTASSHLMFGASLALPAWVGHMVMSSAQLPEPALARLTPKGSPVALGPVLVVVELMSSLIRPLTLSVRLTANMIAGHLLVTLASLQASAGVSVWAVSGLMGALMGLEVAVTWIQAYVFSTLTAIYISEVMSERLLSC